MVEHQDLQMFALKLLQVIFTHLKLGLAVARHNFKWVDMFFNVAL